MNLRRVLLALASVALSLALIALLVRAGKIDVRLTLHQLEEVNRLAFIKLILLNGLLVYLSTEKWRSIDAVLRHASDPIPSRTASFAVTSAGMTLGLVLPVQLGMTAARTFGTSVYGRALTRGTAGTLFEQSFDLLIVLLLTVASGATWLWRGGGLMWTFSAVGMTALALFAVGPLLRLAQWLASYHTRAVVRQKLMGAVLRGFFNLQNSGLLSATLSRRLVVLSAIRFAVVVLMAGQTAEAIRSPIPLWHLAAAIPFVVLACVIAITPGGLGVNELTYASALKVFGTPFSIGAEWALANRVLGEAACVLVTALAITLQTFKRLAAAGK